MSRTVKIASWIGYTLALVGFWAFVLADTNSELGGAVSEIVGTWTTETAILSNTDSSAVANITIGTKSEVDILEVQNFGFDGVITAGAVIDTVTVYVNWGVSTTKSVATLNIYARVVSTNLTTHSNTAEPTSLTEDTYDITAERSWTRADLLDGTFFIRVEAAQGNSATSCTYNYDYVLVEVVWHIPPEGSPQRTLVGVGV